MVSSDSFWEVLNMERAVNSSKKSSMTMIVEGREVALHFSDEPNTQIVVKTK